MKPLPLLILIITLQSFAHADPAYVQGNYAVPQLSQRVVPVVFEEAQSAGNINIVVVGWNDATSTVVSVTDSRGNVYSPATAPKVFNGLSQSIYYAQNIQASPANANTVTVVFNTGAKFVDLRVAEYSGIDPQNPIDVVSSSAGTAGPTSTEVILTTNPTDLLVAANLVMTRVTDPGEQFTSRMITAPDGDILEDRYVTSVDYYSATAPLSQDAGWIMQMVALRAVGSPIQSPGPIATPVTTPTPDPVAAQGQPAYPLKVDPTGRYLVDQNNIPTLLVGDSAHELLGMATPADADMYFANLERYGINALWIQIFCTPYTGNPSSNGSTYDGILPLMDANLYTLQGNINTLNPAYLARLDTMIALAANHHIQIVLDTLDSNGMGDLAKNSGDANCFNYGVALGNRYKNTPNLIWITGNDFQKWRTDASANSAATNIMAGIASVDPNHLQTNQLDFYVSGAHDNGTMLPYVTLGQAYEQFATYAKVLDEYNNTSPILPVLMEEATYENENNTGQSEGTAPNLRKQEYWTQLSGACGQFGGSHWTSGMISGWQNHLDTFYRRELGLCASFFRSIAWYNLIPDQTHTWVTSGFGTYSSTQYPAQNNYVTTAAAADGTLMVSYLPSATTVTVNMSRFSGAVTATWFDPTSGLYTNVSGSFINSGFRNFTSPGNNSSGSPDWVLLITAAVTP